MPGGKFSLPKSAQNQALAAAAASGGIPAPGAVPAPNDLLAMLSKGGMDPQMLMALLAMLAGMGPGGVPGQQAQMAPAGAMPGGQIEAAMGAY